MKKKMALFLILSMCMLGTATVHATESADGSQTENQSDSQDAGLKTAAGTIMRMGRGQPDGSIFRMELIIWMRAPERCRPAG